MKQEDKELLLKDLCARLPYKVKVQDTYYKRLEPNPIWLIDLHAQNVRMFADEGYQSIEYIRPYLFPLSSMTVEQKTSHNFLKHSAYANPIKLVDWYNKNHFDYRGLIENGLAIDATNLNIY